MSEEKKVDESWKEDAVKEKQEAQKSESAPEVKSEESAETAAQEAAPELNFMNYIASLGFQTMIFLGEVPNPITNETDKNINQAKFLIDTLIMLKEKTKGNLDEKEANLLEASVYELQMKYVELANKENK
ncbi:MAG: DUF1844 domain-containing protein [Candidatus Zapsychrus exili]|nr:DUF1844 domain-containing protein [Candidatus Zapsychrus exili]